jgi:hypothetical protein
MILLLLPSSMLLVALLLVMVPLSTSLLVFLSTSLRLLLFLLLLAWYSLYVCDIHSFVTLERNPVQRRVSDGARTPDAFFFFAYDAILLVNCERLHAALREAWKWRRDSKEAVAVQRPVIRLVRVPYDFLSFSHSIFRFVNVMISVGIVPTNRLFETSLGACLL